MNSKGWKFRFWHNVLNFPLYFSVIALLFFSFYVVTIFSHHYFCSRLSSSMLCCLDLSMAFVFRPHCSLLLCIVLSDSMQACYLEETKRALVLAKAQLTTMTQKEVNYNYL